MSRKTITKAKNVNEKVVKYFHDSYDHFNATLGVQEICQFICSILKKSDLDKRYRFIVQGVIAENMGQTTLISSRFLAYEGDDHCFTVQHITGSVIYNFLVFIVYKE